MQLFSVGLDKNNTLLISKALTDGRVSELEFEKTLSELERCLALNQELCYKANKKTNAITANQTEAILT